MSNYYFSRQKRLDKQQTEAMRGLLKINESESKFEQSFDQKGEKGIRVAPMPGVTYYEEPNMLRKFLDYLRITPSEQRFTKPQPAGRSGFI